MFKRTHQRSVGQLLMPSEPLALLVSDSFKKNQNMNDRSQKKGNKHPVCLNCEIKGHVVDKCYKLHGFPPGCKFCPSSGTNDDSTSHQS